MKIFKKLLSREVISYTFFGILTSILNIGLFEFLCVIGLDYKASNLITLIVVKLVAYIVNKVFVFRSKSETITHLGVEFFKFLVTRGGTMVVDYIALIILVDVFHQNTTLSKVFTTVVVVALNYVLGKLLVFTKPTINSPDPTE